MIDYFHFEFLGHPCIRSSCSVFSHYIDSVNPFTLVVHRASKVWPLGLSLRNVEMCGVLQEGPLLIRLVTDVRVVNLNLIVVSILEVITKR